MTFEFDAKDQTIADIRRAHRDRIEGPRLGDYVRFKTGQVERFSNRLTSSLQTSPEKYGSYYLSDSGNTQFSGSLNPPIPLESLSLTEDSLSGEFWFFHHGEVGAHRGVRFTLPCRVYETSADYAGFLRPLA